MMFLQLPKKDSMAEKKNILIKIIWASVSVEHSS